ADRGAGRAVGARREVRRVDRAADGSKTADRPAGDGDITAREGGRGLTRGERQVCGVRAVQQVVVAGDRDRRRHRVDLDGQAAGRVVVAGRIRELAPGHPYRAARRAVDLRRVVRGVQPAAAAEVAERAAGDGDVTAGEVGRGLARGERQMCGVRAVQQV